jgi:1A family penicillin-binding protein
VLARSRSAKGKSEQPSRRSLRRPKLKDVALLLAKAGIVLGLTLTLLFLLMVLFLPLPETRVPQSTQVLDIKGRPVSSVFVEDRIVISGQEMPEYLRKAVVAVEDMRFYSHHGFDPEAFARAVVRNIKARSFAEGGSTLTQQLAKNLFLTQEKTLTRKFVELAYAFKMEMRYSKDEILTMYINQAYWGHGTWGCEVASRTYFGKPAKDLTLSESALLAGLLRSPEYYSPYASMERAVSRRALVLDLMAEQGYITPDEAAAAKDDEVVLAGLPKSVAPYFVSYVIQQVRERHPAIAGDIARGGYRIYTTLDLDMQLAAEKAFAEYIPEGSKDAQGITQPQGALVAVEPKTGHIKAMVGGRNWDESQLNRAYQVRRQPGSAFKIFLYSAVLDTRHPVTELKVCEPVTYGGARAGEEYRPVDYGNRPYHYYPLTIRQALTVSDNVVATKWAQEVGPSTIVDYARRMGIRSPLQADIPLALGASDVVPLDMAVAAATLSAGGVRPEPLSILKIEDARGLVIEENRVKRTQVLDAGTAYVLTSCLRSVLGPYGTGNGLKTWLGDRPAAGKTGTTDDQLEGWFVGYTPELACAVYVGYDHREKSLPATGGAVAGPIWAAFMGEALRDAPIVEWTVPSNVVWAEVCDDTNLLAGPWCPSRHYEVFLRGSLPPVDTGTIWQHGFGSIDTEDPLRSLLLPETVPPEQGGQGSAVTVPPGSVAREVPIIIPEETYIPGLIPKEQPVMPVEPTEPPTGTTPPLPLPSFEDLWRQLFPR